MRDAATVLAVSGAAAVVIGVSVAGAASSRTPGWSEVASITRAKCLSCHVEGGIAPFPLRTYAQVRSHRAAVLAVTQSGRMPPWPPGLRSPRFLGQDSRVLSAAERATIARWVRGGAPRKGGP